MDDTDFSSSLTVRLINRSLLAVTVLATGSSAACAQDEDEDFPPGLLAKYYVEPHAVERVDRVLSFDWGAAAPDERLPQGPFTAEWSGNLLARLPGTHTLHAFVAGQVSVAIDGQEVL